MPTPDDSALELLERQGGPFDHPDARAALRAAYPEWREASYGARMPDGAPVAIALLCDGSRAISLPHNYGGVHASRRLYGQEIRDLLRAARRRAGAHTIVVRSVTTGAGGEAATHLGGRVTGWTSVVHLDATGDPESRCARLARKAIRRARDSGACGRATDDPMGFLALYRASGERHWLRYPDVLLRDLARRGRALCFDVRLEGRVVSSIVALRGASHWTAWLAAQDDEGRAVGGNYLATATMLAHAQSHHVRAVDLGTSFGMPGVALFKRRFGAVDVPLQEFREASPRGRAAQRAAVARERGARRARHAARQARRRAAMIAGRAGT